MPKSPGSHALRQALSSALKRTLQDHPDLNQSKIARALGVTRQAVSLYVNGNAVPSADTLAKAVHLWDLKLDLGGYVVAKQQFPEKPRTHTVSEQLAFDLFAQATELPIPDSPLVLRIQAVDGTISFSIRARKAA